MHNGYTRRQVCLMNQLRKLWEQHVYWTRFLIISTAADLGDLEPVTKRLLQNPKDFAAMFMPFYGPKISHDFSALFTQHLLIAGDLVNAMKKQEPAKIDELRKKWYSNADEIAKFLQDMNPYWNEKKWKTMLYEHLNMTEKEAGCRLAGNYEEDIRVFDNIEEEALKMADYMSHGIIKQFRFC